MICLNISFFLFGFSSVQFSSVLLTRDLYKAKQADVRMSGTTPFTVSSTSQLNLAIVLPEIPSYFVLNCNTFCQYENIPPTLSTIALCICISYESTDLYYSPRCIWRRCICPPRCKCELMYSDGAAAFRAN